MWGERVGQQGLKLNLGRLRLQTAQGRTRERIILFSIIVIETTACLGFAAR